MAVARKLAALPPGSVRTTKKLMRAPVLEVIDEVVAAENAAFNTCMQSPEFGEAISAFMEKRAPDFSSL